MFLIAIAIGFNVETVTYNNLKFQGTIYTVYTKVENLEHVGPKYFVFLWRGCLLFRGSKCIDYMGE